jgi:hypothetical protein
MRKGSIESRIPASAPEPQGWTRELLEDFWPMELPPLEDEILNEHLQPRDPQYPERLDAVRDPLYREGRAFSQVFGPPQEKHFTEQFQTRAKE